jgi:hypothetical protein
MRLILGLLLVLTGTAIGTAQVGPLFPRAAGDAQAASEAALSLSASDWEINDLNSVPPNPSNGHQEAGKQYNVQPKSLPKSLNVTRPVRINRRPQESDDCEVPMFIGIGF